MNDRQAVLSLLNVADGNKKYIESLSKLLNESDAIYLYGAGIYGQRMIDFIEKYAKKNRDKIVGFLDDTADKQGRTLLGVKIYNPLECLKSYNNELILICCDERGHEIIYGNLLKYNVPKEKIVIPEISFVDFNQSSSFIRENIGKIEKIFDSCVDDLSRKTFINVLKYRIAHQPELLSEISVELKNRYFEPGIVECGKDCVYLDCGSYIGDTLKQFIEYTNRHYKKAICCEAVQKNALLISDLVKSEKYENVEVYNIGTWNENTEVMFVEAGEKSGYIGSEGTTKIIVKTIDDILAGQKVDIVKIEVDGAEYESLQGMEKTIQAYNPIIAISVYHNTSDILLIPEKLIESGYKLFLRYYGKTTLTDVVCYAVM